MSWRSWRTVARGALDRALTQQLASRPGQSAQAKIGISFRDNGGRYCRTFQNAASLAGIACREDGRWQIGAIVKSVMEPGNGTAYQLAGSAMPRFVRDAVITMISSASLDAAGARKARAAGWSSH